ncbi:glycoside hydrolase family 16 protein [Ideonella sp. BN130291]|uniref:glycoside hydrolase family 16 protein n=1 Tax=Ideonella sp. BN130291 TaxID=3112940 RepID=UPI002E260580|nr:glycoside hydrolase family 16 protein [Ideonella sp. BN130291]
MKGLRFAGWLLLLGVLAALWASAVTAAEPAAVFFDDFSQRDLATLTQSGWTVRDKRGHPGIEGAAWGGDTVRLVDDPEQPGNRLLRLNARTDGTPKGTHQAQVCHARKYLEGTYAARVRFSDAPVEGPDGDVVVQTFYAVTPLRFDFDPEYSELDWEYLPNGGWGDARTRLYGVSWQTVRLKPWTSYNQTLQAQRSVEGWHVLLMQAAGGRTRWFLDGEALDEHGGRNYPVSPMSINFNLWFSPGGLAKSTAPRTYQQDVDWVFHAKGQVLSTAEVQAAVAAYRQAGTAQVDGVPPANPPLASSCDF